MPDLVRDRKPVIEGIVDGIIPEHLRLQLFELVHAIEESMTRQAQLCLAFTCGQECIPADNLAIHDPVAEARAPMRRS